MNRCWNCGDYIDENGKGCLCSNLRARIAELEDELEQEKISNRNNVDLYEMRCRELEWEIEAQMQSIEDLRHDRQYHVEQVAALEAENKSLKEKELKRSICGLMNIEEYEEVQQELSDLRAKVLRLVEAARNMIGPVPMEYIDIGKTGRYQWNARCAENLKQAIAEVEREV